MSLVMLSSTGAGCLRAPAAAIREWGGDGCTPLPSHVFVTGLERFGVCWLLAENC